MANPPGSEHQSSNMGWIVFLLFLVVVAIAKCGGEDTSSTSQAPPTSAIDADLTGMVAADTKPNAKVEAAAVLQAAADAERALGAFGASGARFYSENCYAFLASRYSAATRDRCLAFDLMAAKATREMGDLAELAWFEEAAVRSRFVNANLSHGDAADAAELHFASVSNLTQGMSVTPVAPPTPVAEFAEAPETETAPPALGVPSSDVSEANLMGSDEALKEIRAIAETETTNGIDVQEVR